MEEQRINLRPDSFVEGGGLLDDFDGTIADARFIMTDYDGKIHEAVPVLDLKFEIDGEETNQLYSVGGSGDFAPDETGRGLIKLKVKGSLTKNAKFSLLMVSLVEAGFPLNRMDSNDISYLIGTNGHFLRKIVTYTGLKKQTDRDNTVLLCTKINKLPWEEGAKKAKGKVKGMDAELTGVVAGIIQEIIVDADGVLAKKDLLTRMFKNEAVMALPDKKAALKLATDDTFLKGREEWTYEDGVLKM